MRHLIFFLAVLVLAGEALAARPDARQMTCRQAQQLVLERGAVVVTTGEHLYKRFVSHYGYCDYWQRAAPAWTATKDNPKCLIGRVCEDRIDRFGFGGFGRF